MAKYRYLLTTGETTTKVEEYIIDLFRLYLMVYPGDIPHAPGIGFDFLLTGITKDDLEYQVKSRVNSLVDKIQDKVKNSSYQIKISSLDLIDEETVKLVIEVNGILSDDMYINIKE